MKECTSLFFEPVQLPCKVIIHRHYLLNFELRVMQSPNGNSLSVLNGAIQFLTRVKLSTVETGS